jgi:adenosylcobinamide-GDP ribazoletransferase
MKSFLVALKFLTILPVGKKLEIQDKTLAKSIKYFPLTGILIGCILALVNFLFSLVFPPIIVSVIILISLIWVTRGFHLDGFMDTVDGLFGGMNKDERLRIMKDTQAGSFGVIALVVLLLLKFTLILELSGQKLFPLILMPALGRWSMVAAMPLYSYPRERGIGSFTKFVRKKDVLIASIIMFVFAIGLLRLEGLVLLFTTFIFMLLITQFISRKIGGMTGDTYGALNEIIEVIILASVYLINSLNLNLYG